MRPFLRLMVCAVLIAVSSNAHAVDLIVYGPRPVHPALSTASILVTGPLTVNLGAYETLIAPGSTLRAAFQVQFKTNTAGLTVDANGNPTTVPSLMVPTGNYGVLLLSQDSISGATPIADWTTSSNPPVLTPTAIPIGYEYWYNPQPTLNYITITNGTAFVDQTNLLAFKQTELMGGPSPMARQRAIYDTSIQAYSLPALGLAISNPVATAPVTSIPGAWIFDQTVTNQNYVFQEMDLTFLDPTQDDPFMLDGCLLTVTQSVLDAGGLVHLTYNRGDGIQVMATVPASKDHGVAALPASMQAQVNPLLNGYPPIVVISATPNRDPAVQTLADNLDAADQTATNTVNPALGPNLNATGLFTANGNDPNSVGLVNNGNFSNGTGTPSFDATLAALPTGEQITNFQQVTQNANLVQVAPTIDQLPPPATETALLQGPPPLVSSLTDPTAQSLRQSIVQVEAWMALQGPASGPLRGGIPTVKAEMDPAGIRPYYLQGNPVPGDGTNPVQPLPSGVSPTGAPAYDLDGNGSLDRYNTTDPFGNGYASLELDWDITENNFYLENYDGMGCMFAVYGIKDDGTKDFLFCGRDGRCYSSWKQSLLSGRIIKSKSVYSYALSSLLQPTGNPNEYLFSLVYKGTAQPSLPATVPPVPRVVTANGTIMQSVTIGNTAISGPQEIWSETAYLYDNLVVQGYLTAASLVGATYSDPTFTPRTITGTPAAGAKFVRVSTPYIFQNGQFVAQPQITEVVYYPADFREDQLQPADVTPTITSVQNAFDWGYTLGSDGIPWNYTKGDRFVTGINGVILNEPTIVQHWGTTSPMMTVPSIITSPTSSISFIVREDPAINPPAALQDWINVRSMYHTPFDGRTDMSPGQNWGNPSGRRHFTIVQGVGWYIYKGQQVYYRSTAEQEALLAKMWAWRTEQPSTVYQIMHAGNDPTKPLLNTVLGVTDANSSQVSGLNGSLEAEVTVNGSYNQVDVKRRDDLINYQYMFFSAARGRQHEIEYALAAPVSTRLFCVEWDDFDSVQKVFANSGHHVNYIFNKDDERRLKGAINESIFGSVAVQTRLSAGYPVTTVVGDPNVWNNMQTVGGQYFFSTQDMLYNEPACFLPNVALLNDGQYGAPTTNQWVGPYTMQYRHPMVIAYNDQTSSLFVAYGANADPMVWVPLWSSYAPTTEVNGPGYSVICRQQFESWANSQNLSTIYDALNQTLYQQVVAGSAPLPAAPTSVPVPIQPTQPAAWSGGSLIPPAVVDAPGAEPTPPVPPWAGLPGYDGLDNVTAQNMYVGPQPPTNPQVTWSWDYSDFYGRPGNVGTLGGGDEGNGFGAMAVEYNNGYTGPGNIFLGTVTWTQPTTTFQLTWYIDNYAVFYTAPSPFPSGDTPFYQNYLPGGTTELFQSTNQYYWQGTDTLTFVQGQNYYFRLDFDGEGQPNEFYLKTFNPAYPGWLARYNAAQTFDAAYAQWQTADAAWQANNTAYNAYVVALNVYNTTVIAYAAWLNVYQQEQQAYEAALITYQDQVAAYTQYQAAYAAWQQQIGALQPLVTQWQAYENARSSWIYLVISEINQPGVNWNSGDPIFDAYNYWYNSINCGACNG